ncbi:MAG: RNA polymerase factor sigma-54 [Planctomycetes bacterium]|nr:RNA polymerase factor sigma-54 [Planctomycetota bacterium]
MKMEISLQPRLELKLKLAPQIIQSIEILQLPMLALQDRITQELEENPALELEEPAPAEEEAAAETAVEEVSDRAEQAEEYERLADLADGWQDFFTQVGGRRFRASGDKDEKLEALQNTAAPPVGLQDHLYTQLMLLDLPKEKQELAENIIYNLDPNGYLRHPLAEIGESLDPPRTEEEMAVALKVVQDLEPPGVAASDLEECLLLQLDADEPNYALKRQLITNHLKDIENNRLPKIAKALGQSLDTVKGLIEEIGSLNPKPGALYGGDVVPYIIPDVVVEEDKDEYVIQLQDHFLPNLYISPEFRGMLRDSKNQGETKEWIRRKIEAAKWLIESIEQRRSTLHRVSQKIVERQKDFFDHGIKHLKPLKMQEVADELGIHVSTVSRAIAHKYMQSPRGIHDMKFFFTGGLAKDNGEVESWNAVKQKLLEVIDKEDKRNPLSDDDITKKLQEQGIDIARRTVTKYRKALKIPSSRKRKEY